MSFALAQVTLEGNSACIIRFKLFNTYQEECRLRASPAFAKDTTV
jgi:hypothetical protein